MTMMSNGGGFGDTTLTKVFVGGLAWETPKDAMREHFEKYGDILEAVIISDKLSGRSKGYGFVTFKDAESARKACEDATPIINGRRANCNLASLGARRPRSASTTPPPPHPQGAPNCNPNVGPRATPPPPAPAMQMQWYYPAATHFPHQPHAALPFYGYSPSPTYIATHDITNYNQTQKVGYTGAYMNGRYTHPQMFPGQAMVSGNTLMPMYPVYRYHQSQAMGLPAHMFVPAGGAAHIAALPAIVSKPPPTPGTLDHTLPQFHIQVSECMSETESYYCVT